MLESDCKFYNNTLSGVYCVAWTVVRKYTFIVIMEMEISSQKWKTTNGGLLKWLQSWKALYQRTMQHISVFVLWGYVFRVPKMLLPYIDLCHTQCNDNASSLFSYFRSRIYHFHFLVSGHQMHCPASHFGNLRYSIGLFTKNSHHLRGPDCLYHIHICKGISVIGDARKLYCIWGLWC